MTKTNRTPARLTQEEAAACTHPDLAPHVENDLGWFR
jgi:hypothetical protein